MKFCHYFSPWVWFALLLDIIKWLFFIHKIVVAWKLSAGKIALFANYLSAKRNFYHHLRNVIFGLIDSQFEKIGVDKFNQISLYKLLLKNYKLVIKKLFFNDIINLNNYNLNFDSETIHFLNFHRIISQDFQVSFRV